MKSDQRSVRRRYRNDVQMKRLRAGYKTQKEFAREVGICSSVLCEIECNKRFLSSPIALRICEVLECKMDDLFIRRDIL